MVFTSLMPYSRIMRASPHQSDDQKKETYGLLLQEAAEEEEEREEGEENMPTTKSLSDQGPFIKQVLPSKSSGLPSDPASPKDLPTFIAPQGLHSFQLPCNRESRKNAISHPWFVQIDRNSRHLVPLCEEDDAFTESFFVPSSDVREDSHAQQHSLLHSKTKKDDSDDQPHRYRKQKSSRQKISAGVAKSIYGLTLEHNLSKHEAGEVKKRHSSASVEDMIVRRQEMPTDVQPASWEEEVRQAMAKNSLCQRQSEDAYKEEGGGYGSLQRSISVREHGISMLPPTLIVKRPASYVNVDAANSPEESGRSFRHDTLLGSHVRHTQSAAQKKRMWKGFTVVKSPREERWEEAAQDEERQETLRRRARSQSMRYDCTSLRATELTGVGESSEAFFGSHAPYIDDDQWALYTRSGYVNVRPRRSDAEATARCCSSLLGRSLSMRDTRMGLVMECAACGTALKAGGGGHLLCFCSCCVASRAAKQEAGMPMPDKKKGGRGILGACRRLFGLSKKRPTNGKI